jgi:hypothetical protein
VSNKAWYLSQCNGLSCLFKWNVCAGRAIHIVFGLCSISKICTAPCIYCLESTDSDSSIKHRENIMFWMNRQWFKYSTFIRILIIPSNVLAVNALKVILLKIILPTCLTMSTYLLFIEKPTHQYKSFYLLCIFLLKEKEQCIEQHMCLKQTMHRVMHMYHTKHISWNALLPKEEEGMHCWMHSP